MEKGRVEGDMPGCSPTIALYLQTTQVALNLVINFLDQTLQCNVGIQSITASAYKEVLSSLC